jgi:methionyl-tRNA formyltransferase
MRLVMMGTGPFAVPTFRALLASGHEVVALFTRPPRTGAGKHRTADNPMQTVAEERGLPIHWPESIKAPEAIAQLTALAPDLLVVCDYGQILSSAALATARLGGINLHGSLLPKYRGAAPINWALYHGEAETGVTVIHMTPRLDAGPAISQVRTPIGPAETTPQVEARLAELGAPAVLQAIAALEAGTAQPLVQDETLTTPAPRLNKAMGELDWSRSALELSCQVRAFQPWPASYTFWRRGAGEPLRLIVDRALPLEPAAAAPPGTVVAAEGKQLEIATGRGRLAIEAIQPAGKRVLTIPEFLNGYPLRTGDRLG